MEHSYRGGEQGEALVILSGGLAGLQTGKHMGTDGGVNYC